MTDARRLLAELNGKINDRIFEKTPDPIAHDLARFVKIVEELGEAATELIETHALNFRKTADQVAAANRYAEELLDGALTLILAHADFTQADSLQALRLHLENRHRRAFRNAQSVTDCQDRGDADEGSGPAARFSLKSPLGAIAAPILTFRHRE